MKRIIGYNGKTLEELVVVFHCSKCGCDFEADHGEYSKGGTRNPTWCSYCPSCHKQVFVDIDKSDTNYIIQKLESEIFQEYNVDEVESRDACECHAMTSEHTEILGQFLDYSGMNVEQLKNCLIGGYLSCLRGATAFLTQSEYEELIEYRNRKR